MRAHSLQVAERQAGLFPDGQRKAAPVQTGPAHVLDLLHVLLHNVCDRQRRSRLAAQPLHVAHVLHAPLQVEAGILWRRRELVCHQRLCVPCMTPPITYPCRNCGWSFGQGRKHDVQGSASAKKGGRAASWCRMVISSKSAISIKVRHATGSHFRWT